MSKSTEYSLCALSTYSILVLTVLEQIKILIYDIYLTKRLCQDQCSFLYTGLQIYVKMRQASIILFFFIYSCDCQSLPWFSIRNTMVNIFILSQENESHRVSSRFSTSYFQLIVISYISVTYFFITVTHFHMALMG